MSSVSFFGGLPPLQNPIGVSGPIKAPGGVISPGTPIKPRGNPVQPVPVTSRFGLNNLPAGPRATGLPSPSVGTVIAQTRAVPHAPLSNLAFATPVVGASFGVLATTPPSPIARGNPLQNNISDRH